MPLIRTLAAALAALLLFAAPASAVPATGSAAWINWDTPLFDGPGAVYGETGTVGKGARVRVDRCSRFWCQIHAPHLSGWVKLSALNFGQAPGGFPYYHGLHISGGSSVCFYTGANYTGARHCYGPGVVVSDLQLYGLDNSFSSVTVGSGSVLACRGRNFRSHCQYITADMPVLPGFLNDGMTSFRVN